MIEESTKQWIKDRLIDSEFLVEFTKKDGTKTSPPFEPSNLMITELKVDGKVKEKAAKQSK